MTEFLAMNGYGGYVWSSIGFSLLVLAGLALSFYWRHQRLRKRLMQYLLEEDLANFRKQDESSKA